MSIRITIQRQAELLHQIDQQIASQQDLLNLVSSVPNPAAEVVQAGASICERLTALERLSVFVKKIPLELGKG